MKNATLVALGVGLMTVGAFSVGRAALHRPRKTIQMDEVAIVGNVDAGFEKLSTFQPAATVDAGTKPFSNAERRAAFKAQLDLLAMDIGIKMGDTVTVQSVMFAVNNNEKADAAIVVMHAEKANDTTGLFFVFTKGSWQTFPSDFQ